MTAINSSKQLFNAIKRGTNVYSNSLYPENSGKFNNSRKNALIDIANLSVIDPVTGYTPLLLACSLGQEKIAHEIIYTDNKTVFFQSERDGTTPLMQASAMGLISVVTKIITILKQNYVLDTHINLKSKNNKTALLMTCNAIKNKEDIAIALIEAGATFEPTSPKERQLCYNIRGIKDRFSTPEELAPAPTTRPNTISVPISRPISITNERNPVISEDPDITMIRNPMLKRIVFPPQLSRRSLIQTTSNPITQTTSGKKRKTFNQNVQPIRIGGKSRRSKRNRKTKRKHRH